MSNTVRPPYEYRQDKAAFISWINAANDVPDENRSYALSLMGMALGPYTKFLRRVLGLQGICRCSYHAYDAVRDIEEILRTAEGGVSNAVTELHDEG